MTSENRHWIDSSSSAVAAAGVVRTRARKTALTRKPGAIAMVDENGVSYSSFADQYAQLVGDQGARLAAAMRRQLEGEDTDVAEINWQVQVATRENTNETFANVQADFDRRRLHFTLDERDAAAMDSPSMTTLEFVLWLGERQQIVCGADVAELRPTRLLEELARFRSVCEEQR